MIFVNAVELLSCTVGQLQLHGFQEGVKYSDLDKFAQIFKSKLIDQALNKEYIIFEYPTGDVHYTNDKWRQHFRYFMKQYSVLPQEKLSGKLQITVQKALDKLKSDCVTNGLSSLEAEEVIKTSVQQFLDSFYQSKTEENTSFQKTKHIQRDYQV